MGIWGLPVTFTLAPPEIKPTLQLLPKMTLSTHLNYFHKRDWLFYHLILGVDRA